MRYSQAWGTTRTAPPRALHSSRVSPGSAWPKFSASVIVRNKIRKQAWPLAHLFESRVFRCRPITTLRTTSAPTVATWAIADHSSVGNVHALSQMSYTQDTFVQ